MDSYVIAIVEDGKVMVYAGDVTVMGMTYPTFTDDYSGAYLYADWDTAHARRVSMLPAYMGLKLIVCTIDDI